MNLEYVEQDDIESIDYEGKSNSDLSVSNASEIVENKDENDPTHFDKLCLEFVFSSIADKPFSGASSSFMPSYSLANLVQGIFRNSISEIGTTAAEIKLSLNINLHNFLCLFSFVLLNSIDDEDKNEDFRLDLYVLYCNLKNDLHSFTYWQENLFAAEWSDSVMDYLNEILIRKIPIQFSKRKECDPLICTEENSSRKFVGEEIFKIAKQCAEDMKLDSMEIAYDQSKAEANGDGILLSQLFRRKLFVANNAMPSRHLKDKVQERMLSEFDLTPDKHSWYHPCQIAFFALLAMTDECIKRKWIYNLTELGNELSQCEKELSRMKKAASDHLATILPKSIAVKKQHIPTSSRKKRKVDDIVGNTKVTVHDTSQPRIELLKQILDVANQRIALFQNWKTDDPDNDAILDELAKARSTYSEYTMKLLTCLIEKDKSTL